MTDRELETLKMAELGRLSAGIVHEINTPVGSILSNNHVVERSLVLLRKRLEELSRTAEVPPKVMQLVDTLQSLAGVDKIACERILAMVRSVKTFARADEEARQADINALLDETLQLALPTFRTRIEVERAYGELPPVGCYPNLVNQVFLNIVTNAAQAIEGEGRITLRTCRDGDSVEVAVTDTGHGIRPEDRLKIFERGFTTKPVGEGAGLGLAFSKDIVETRHGGSLRFESEPGAGTTFIVRLPVEQSKKRPGE